LPLSGSSGPLFYTFFICGDTCFASLQLMNFVSQGFSRHPEVAAECLLPPGSHLVWLPRGKLVEGTIHFSTLAVPNASTFPEDFPLTFPPLTVRKTAAKPVSFLMLFSLGKSPRMIWLIYGFAPLSHGGGSWLSVLRPQGPFRLADLEPVPSHPRYPSLPPPDDGYFGNSVYTIKTSDIMIVIY